MRKTKKTFIEKHEKVFKKIVGFIFLSSLIGNIILSLPNISLLPRGTDNKEFPFENLFTLSNNSNYAIYDIECKIADKQIKGNLPMVIYSKAPGGRTASDGVEKIKKLGRGRSVSIDIAKLMGILVSQPDEGSMVIEISYRSLIWPFKKRIYFPFRLYKMVDGRYQLGSQ